MAFRYMNPGLVELLDSDCVATQVTGSQYSRTGVAFKQTGYMAGVTLPTFAEGDDFWARFDVYVNGYSNFFLLIPRNMYSGIRFEYGPNSSPTCKLYGFYNSSSLSDIARGSASALGVRDGAINTFLLHVVYGNTSSESLLEVFINGEKFTRTPYAAIPYSVNYEAKARLYSSSSESLYFSNVIFSNEEISPKEKVIALPVSSTLTDMTAGASGIYIADTVNQQLLQSVDVSELAENFGANSAVTGIQVVGNPAYATGTGITTLTVLSKSGGVVSEKGSYSLSDDTSAVVMDGWGLSGVTLADLQNMQFGWKVGE